MKKTFSAILSLLLLSSVSMSAFAADTRTSEDSEGSWITVGDLNTSDPAYASVKEDYQTIVSLRAQEKALLEAIKTQTASNKAVGEEIRSTLKSQIEAAKATFKETNQSLIDEIAQLKEQRQSIIGQMASAKANNDTVVLAALKTQFTEINQQIKTDLKTLKSNAPDMTEYDAVKSQINELNTQIEALRSQMKANENDIKANQATVKSAWQGALAAVKSKDYSAVDAALKDIISCKELITADMNEIIGHEQQVAALLADFVAVKGIAVSG